MKTIIAIIAVAALDLFALSQGIDGKYLIGTAIIIAGLGGYDVLKRTKK